MVKRPNPSSVQSAASKGWPISSTDADVRTIRIDDSAPAIDSTVGTCLWPSNAEAKTPAAQATKIATRNEPVMVMNQGLPSEIGLGLFNDFLPATTRSPCSIARGGGGLPGTSKSTGKTALTPHAHMKLLPKTPPAIAQPPTAITFLVVGMASQVLSSGPRMFSLTGPTTSRRSAVRGVAVKKNPRRCML